jgi:hypothetical protein
MKDFLQRLWSSEPAILTAAGSVLFWQTLFEGFDVFGHPFTSAQQSWLGGVGIAVATFIIRQQVTSPATLEALTPATLKTAQQTTEPVRDTVKKLPSFFLALTLSGALVASAGCGGISPRVTIDKVDRAAYTALRGLQTEEEATWHANVGWPSADQHQAINGKISQAYTLIVDVANLGLSLPANASLSTADLSAVEQLTTLISDIMSLVQSAPAPVQSNAAVAQARVQDLVRTVTGRLQ